MNCMKGRNMKTERFQIGTIPAVLYGEPARQGYLFLHGQMGRKEEAEAFARVVCPKGWQVVSIDLPGHGERWDRDEELAPWTAVPDIRTALDWMEHRWKTTALRANSIGAYFAMLAFDKPAVALLVSPILDMEELILTMMGWDGITEEQLRRQGEIAASSGQILSWNYLCWVREHTIRDWTCPIRILYGSEDKMISRRTVEDYIRQHDAKLTVMESGEHWFHTPEQLTVLREWEETET